MPEQVFASPYQWNLYSSDGRSCVRGSFHRAWTNAEGIDVVLSDLRIVSNWPDRTRERMNFRILNDDLVVVLPQLVLAKPSLQALIANLQNWLENVAEFSCELSPESKNQKINMSLQPTTIPNALRKGRFVMEYSAQVFERGMWSFVVDQSCVSILLDELQQAVLSIGV